MGPREIGWRAGRAVSSCLHDLRGEPAHPVPASALARFRDRPALLDAAVADHVAAADPGGVAAVLRAAERAADHRFAFFAHPEVRYDGPIDWSFDPVSGVRWPDRPARRIDHRTTAGDPKWIWELHRLGHLPWLAQAWVLARDEAAGEELLAQLDAWAVSNPVGRGIGWRGAFECGVRAISVITALQAVRDHPGLTAERYARAVHVLAAGARRCWRDRSRHSSANNHLVGELAGLAVVALTCPDLAGAPRWRDRALSGLAQEAGRQILPDGVGAEQAVAYHVFTADLLAVVLATLRLHGDPSPTAAVLEAALDRGATHLAALVGNGDPPTRDGDDDEGVVLRLDAAAARGVRAHLATVAALTGHPGAVRNGLPDVTSAWFAARTPPTRPRTDAAPAPGSRYAAHGGLVVLRSGARRAIVDVGPLGYTALAAHGHADALATTLAHGGRELIGDPGTASYYGHPAWRRAARGTRSHATLTVDGLDQSVIGGPFLWTRHARVRVHEVDLVRGLVDAEHDGYRRLPDPVGHRRRVLAPPGAAWLLVVDLVAAAAAHELRTSWPLPPDLDALPCAHGFDVVARDSETVVLGLRQAATVPWRSTAVRGDEESGLGWWSTRLESREPSWLLGGAGTSAGPLAVVATVLGAGVPVDVPSVHLATDAVTVCWRADGVTHREVVPHPPRPR